MDETDAAKGVVLGQHVRGPAIGIMIEAEVYSEAHKVGAARLAVEVEDVAALA